MALTPSTMHPLGTTLPAFSLPDTVSARTVADGDFADKKALLVLFICAHCPYVIHVQEELARLGRDFANREVGIVAISANDAAEYPDDAPEKLAAFARANNFNFPLLYDETQNVAKAFTAACTPDIFLFDQNRKLVYRGQLDSSRPRNGVANGEDIRAALEAVLAGKPVSANQKPSIGCNIKWKSGSAPSY